MSETFEIAGWKLKDCDDGEYVLSHPEYGGSVIFPPSHKHSEGILENLAWYFVRDLMWKLADDELAKTEGDHEQ